MTRQRTRHPGSAASDRAEALRAAIRRTLRPSDPPFVHRLVEDNAAWGCMLDDVARHIAAAADFTDGDQDQISMGMRAIAGSAVRIALLHVVSLAREAGNEGGHNDENMDRRAAAKTRYAAIREAWAKLGKAPTVAARIAILRRRYGWSETTIRRALKQAN